MGWNEAEAQGRHRPLLLPVRVAGEANGLSRTIKVPSADMGHVTKKGCLHAAGAQLVHPEGRLVLQGCAARVESEVYAVVEQTAERGHVEVREAHEAPGEVGRVVEGAEDATKLSIEQGLRDAPRQRNTLRLSKRAEKAGRGFLPRIRSAHLSSCRSFIQVASTCRDSAS